MYSQIVLFCRSGISYYGFLINLWTSHRLSLLVPYHCISVFCNHNAYYLPVAWVTQWRIIISMTVFIADFFSRNQTYYASCPPIYGYYWSFGLHDLYSTGSLLRSYEIYSTPDFFPRGCLDFSELCQLRGIIPAFHMRIHRTAAWHLLLSARGAYLYVCPTLRTSSVYLSD